MADTEVRTDLSSLIAEYVERNPRSRQLAERAQQSLPGGNTRSGVWLDPFPPYVERGQGHYLYDVDGHDLLDFVFNNSSLILGHAHPAVVEAIARQAALGTGFSRPTELEIQLAEVLQERVASVERIRFCNSGTEANLNAIRAAIAFTGKRTIAKFEGAYHGVSDHALISLNPPFGPDAGPPQRPQPLPSSLGLSGAADEVLVLPFNDLAACEILIEEHADHLAAVLIDPLITGAGMMHPVAGFLPGLRAITERLGILLIFDEVITFRVARGGAQERFGIRPDLTAFGKIIAGGTPGGAFGGRADVMALFDPTSGAPKIPQAGTFNANPLTMVAGLATLDLLTPAAYDQMEALAQRAVDELTAIFTETGVAACASSAGSIFRIYVLEAPPRDYRDMAHDDRAMQRTLFFWLLNHGIHWTQGGYISLVTDETHLDRLCSTVRAALRESDRG